MGNPTPTSMRTIAALLLAAAVAVAVPLADPVQPHLAQAWTAMSSGDGLPNQVGFEQYIYEDQKVEGGLRGHTFDYPDAGCKKIEVSSNDIHALQGTFYLKCDAVDCCFSTVGGHGGSKPARPDVKKWDLAQNGLGKKVAYAGSHDIKDLYNDVPEAETWFEKDHIPFTKVGVNYTYYITRNGTDIITHKIHYSAPGAAPGDILFGNFSVQHDVESFRQNFVPPAQCNPQGSGKGHALSCNEDKVKQWEAKYFKHSAAYNGLI